MLIPFYLAAETLFMAGKKKAITLTEFRGWCDHINDSFSLGEADWVEIRLSRAFLEEKIRTSEKPIYGINTGFGELCREEISAEDLEQLQVNLVRSHACGVGRPVPERISEMMLLLKIIGFRTGHSAASPELVQALIDFRNAGGCPVVFEQGSLGASGDLVPLAHLTLPLLGEGEVWENGNRIPAIQFLKSRNLKPYRLKAKEGLAMLNGTQFMLAYGLESYFRAEKAFENGLAAFAMAMDAFDGRMDFLFKGIHQIRGQKGQQRVAARLSALRKGSQLAMRPKNQVQDPYSLRCLPQVLGASSDALQYAAGILETELNAITDNPLVFRKENRVVSGGNFHGQPLALILDYMAIACSEVANIAERLLYKLISGERGLPVFLTANPGLESGFMIPQYSAAALVSQNKQLSVPASVDSIVSSNGQEDHVSMGANSGLKLLQVVENTEAVLGVLLLTAAQALDFRRPLKTGQIVEAMHTELRKEVPFRKEDALFKPDMDAATQLIKTHRLEA
jgi:histidine ammonia-lyase